jgi:hypothetical protein
VETFPVNICAANCAILTLHGAFYRNVSSILAVAATGDESGTRQARRARKVWRRSESGAGLLGEPGRPRRRD